MKSTTNLENKFRASVQKHGVVVPGEGVVLGVSGGADSVAMFHLMVGLSEERGLGLAVAHLIHGLRGDEAREDARFVAQLADRWNVPFFLKEIDVPQMRLSQGKGNLEALARRERYRFFCEVAATCGFHKVATAHTQDDQAETVAMWFLRGAGRRGLSGIAPQRTVAVDGQSIQENLTVVRPLLEISREEILTYLRDRNLEYRTDSTNFDCRFLRNWTRHQLLPQLKARIDDNVSERLAQVAGIFRDEEKVLEDITSQRLDAVTTRQSLVVSALLTENIALQRRLFRRWLESNSDQLRGTAFSDVETALEFMARGPSQGRLSLPKGYDLVKEYDHVRLERSRRKKPSLPCYSYLLPQEGDVMVAEAGVTFHTLRSAHKGVTTRPEDDLEAYFDADSLPERLSVRNFRTGDRFQPLGMKGHKKVKDLFIEKKIPLSIRRNLPLLVAGEQILWIPRYGRSEVARPGPNAREILKVRILPIQG